MKPIKITGEQKQKILSEFEKFISVERFSDPQLIYKTSLEAMLPENIKKPEVYFTPKAYTKMLKLVLNTKTEIGWHGTVERTDNKFLITDIIVYPQIVSTSTVTTDDLEYMSWLMNQPDEIFNKIRFQGHSHVNFSVSPSGVDTTFYDSILQTLQENDYYIFLIINKSHDINIMIYDFSQNVIFDKSDITIDILFKNSQTYKEWQKDIEHLIESRTTSYYNQQTKEITPASTIKPLGYEYPSRRPIHDVNELIVIDEHRYKYDEQYREEVYINTVKNAAKLTKQEKKKLKEQEKLKRKEEKHGYK